MVADLISSPETRLGISAIQAAFPTLPRCLDADSISRRAITTATAKPTLAISSLSQPTRPDFGILLHQTAQPISSVGVQFLRAAQVREIYRLPGYNNR